MNQDLMTDTGQSACIRALQAQARAIHLTLPRTRDPLARRNLRLNLDAVERRLFELTGYYGDYTPGREVRS